VHSVGAGTDVPGRGWSVRQDEMTLPEPPWLTGPPWLGVTPGPEAEPVTGRMSIRPAMRISAVSASVTAIRCNTPLYGPAIPDAKTTSCARRGAAASVTGGQDLHLPGRGCSPCLVLAARHRRHPRAAGARSRAGTLTGRPVPLGGG
jgi:hypothetical protein